VEFVIDSPRYYPRIHGVDRGDNLLLSGWAEVERAVSYSGISDQDPFIAKLDGDGALRWVFRETDRSVTGVVNAVVSDGGDNVFQVSTEDPVSYELSPGESREGHCTLYGCDGVVARKFSADGALLWSYEHRSAHSYGRDLALDSEGRVAVLGRVEREEPSGLLLTFEPD
jgi:hypothetical protein